LNDDASGFLDLDEFPDGDAAERACEEGTGPALLFDTRGETVTASTDPDFLMDALKTPVAGFSNGSRQFALFYLAKPKGCVANADCDNGLECDPGLGFMLEEYFDERDITVFCADGTLGCLQNTMIDSSGMPVQNSGFCVDPTSSVATNDTGGRIASTAITLRMTVRDEANRSRFIGRDWLTTRFSNPAATTVDRFTPSDALDRDYRPADGVAPGKERVFVWGRPRFAGVGARSRDLALYFAYADMPQADGSNEFSWSPRYFTHVDPGTGAPRFSSNERDAAPLDLSGGSGDPHEEHDLVQQMSIRWIEPLDRWVMFYGGGASRLGPNDLRCPIIESLIGPLCDSEIVYGNGAVRMRTAKDPWGPWSPPVDVLVPGDPAAGPAPGSLYAPGGILHHPDCEGATCAPRTDYYPATEYGVLYAANIIDTWTEERAGAVDLYWNVSTWNPYGVSLVRTRLR
jgi:hypothetical protein